MKRYTLMENAEGTKRYSAPGSKGEAIENVFEADPGDVVDNVPVKWLGEVPAVLLNVGVFLTVVFSAVLDQNILSFFITDPGLLATITRWLTGIVALITILLMARQNFVITPKVSPK